MDAVSGFGWGLLMEAGRRFFNLVYVVSSKYLSPIYRSYFPKYSVIILGEAKAGKSCLIALLQTGRPFLTLADGTRKAPEPTTGIVILPESKLRIGDDKIHQWTKIIQDVGGDQKIQIDLWPKIIQEVDPNGIIYVVEGDLSPQRIEAQFKALGEFVLSHYMGGLRSLTTLYIFLNKCDNWEKVPSDRIELGMKWDTLFLKCAKEAIPALRPLNFRVMPTQLSQDRNTWPEAQMALASFAGALDLKSKR